MKRITSQNSPKPTAAKTSENIPSGFVLDSPRVQSSEAAGTSAPRKTTQTSFMEIGGWPKNKGCYVVSLAKEKKTHEIEALKATRIELLTRLTAGRENGGNQWDLQKRLLDIDLLIFRARKQRG